MAKMKMQSIMAFFLTLENKNAVFAVFGTSLISLLSNSVAFVVCQMCVYALDYTSTDFY